MVDLFVVDFDKTLIKENSVATLIKELKIKKLLFYAILRKIHLINKRKFALKATQICQDYFDIYGASKAVDVLENKTNEKVLAHLNKMRTEKCQVVVLSASPHIYVSAFAEKLGFTGFGSRFREQSFRYLYGENKTSFLKKHFPRNTYNYFYAISDNASDLNLLNLFANSYFLDTANKITTPKNNIIENQVEKGL